MRRLDYVYPTLLFVFVCVCPVLLFFYAIAVALVASVLCFGMRQTDTFFSLRKFWRDCHWVLSLNNAVNKNFARTVGSISSLQYFICTWNIVELF
jgi:hypothetical protein